MNKCYRCGTTEELSKRGKTVMICKSCRRDEYKRYQASKDPKPRKLRERKELRPKKHICSSCGSEKNVYFSDLRINRIKWKCEKCADKVTSRISLNIYESNVSKEWLELSNMTVKRISARFR